jgi:hypothetical protein
LPLHNEEGADRTSKGIPSLCNDEDCSESKTTIYQRIPSQRNDEDSADCKTKQSVSMYIKGYKRNAKSPFCHSGRAKPNPRKTREDFEYNVGLAKQTSAFEVTIESLITYIKGN